MKKFNIQLLSLLVILSLAFTTSFAQQEQNSKVVIIQKIENADGTTSTVKKVIDGEKGLQSILENLQTLENNQSGSNTDINVEVKDEDLLMYFRKASNKKGEAQKEMEELKIFMSGDLENFKLDDIHFSEKEKITKPLLGVYADESGNGEGLKLSGIVSGKGAESAGLKSGDIVTQINGNAINNVYDLRNELNKFKPGESVNVNYTRDGKAASTQVVLAESTRWRTKRNPCKVFIGVQLGGENFAGRGVNIDGIIAGWPAEKAGLLAGDIILALDDVEVNDNNELLIERNKHASGEFFTLSILRGGNEIDVEAQFRTCDEQETEEEVIEEPVIEVIEEDIPEIKQDGPVDNNDLGIELKLESYKAFPNPTYGKVRLQFIAEEGPTTIQVMDFTGKVLFKENLWHFDGYYNKEIDIKDGIPGTVIVHISQDGNKVSKKLVLMPRA
jgi:PDZ domain-containing secreted protein